MNKSSSPLQDALKGSFKECSNTKLHSSCITSISNTIPDIKSSLTSVTDEEIIRDMDSAPVLKVKQRILELIMAKSIPALTTKTLHNRNQLNRTKGSFTCTSPKNITKDKDYIERRRRNNDSARRSREMRKQREHTNRQKMQILEQENMRLRAQIATLRVELNQLALVILSEHKKIL